VEEGFYCLDGVVVPSECGGSVEEVGSAMVGGGVVVEVSE